MEIPFEQHIIGQLRDSAVTFLAQIYLVEKLVEGGLDLAKLALAVLDLEAHLAAALFLADLFHRLEHFMHTADEFCDDEYCNQRSQRANHEDNTPADDIRCCGERTECAGIRYADPSPCGDIRDYTAGISVLARIAGNHIFGIIVA